MMRRTLTLILLLILVLPRLAAERVWTPESLPVMQTRRAGDYVVNPEGLVSAAAADAVNRRLRQLERDKGVQSVAIVVGRIEGGDAYEFGMGVARRYGIGLKDQNTGLIILIATRDRKYQILTGRGLEGALPDAICRRVENREMLPRLHQSDWSGALTATVQAIDTYVRGDDSLKPSNKPSAAPLFDPIMGYCFAIAFVVALILIFGRRGNRLCPQCRKGQLRLVNRRRLRVAGHWVIRSTWQCPRCGHEETHDENDNSFGGGAFIPPIFMGGSGFGGGNGGSSFGGDSFGGGDFGGGGSGGNF